MGQEGKGKAKCGDRIVFLTLVVQVMAWAFHLLLLLLFIIVIIIIAFFN